MKWLAHLLIICLASGCVPKKKRETPLINEPDPALVERLNKVESSLKGQGLQYSEQYRRYSGVSTGQPPCDPKLREVMESATRETKEIERQTLTRDEKLFRHKALDFRRRVEWQSKSIETVSDSLESYCTFDDLKVKRCLQHSEPVTVLINQNIGGSIAAHPVVKLKPDDRIGIYSYGEDNGVRMKSLDTMTDRHDGPLFLLIKNTNLVQLVNISNCLASSDLRSDTGKNISATLKSAFNLALYECDRHSGSQVKVVGPNKELVPLDEKFCRLKP